MKSNVFKIENGINDLNVFLKETEKVACYNDFNHKQTLHLRLLCEELDGMLPKLLGGFFGETWIEVENGVCKINVSVEIDGINTGRREELISISKNKKNSIANGIVGKIRAAVESLFLDVDFIGPYDMSLSGAEYITTQSFYSTHSRCWSLGQYKNSIDNLEAKDELEKSVIASLADDVVVGIKGRSVDIIIIKDFNK